MNIHETTIIDPDVEANRFMAALSYVWILCLIPLLLRRQSKFAQFHAKQGLILFIFGIIVSWLQPGLIHDILLAVAVIFSAIGFVKTYNREWWQAPLVYNISQKIKL